MKEQTIENMMKKRPIYEPPRYMTNQQAAEQLMEIVRSKSEMSESLVLYPLTFHLYTFLNLRTDVGNPLCRRSTRRLAGSENCRLHSRTNDEMRNGCATSLLDHCW